ncbi:MAG: dihydroorotase [Alphaproteobacteria bacterium]|nr:dihydroorotase [Alphaproteobacteria bacterium]
MAARDIAQGDARKPATGRVAYVNARLLDPASGLDTKGGLVTDGEAIAALGPEVTAKSHPEGTIIVDCGGHCLAPGLVDMRVQVREPGEEHKETIASASRAAVAGGVTAMVCLPNTEPLIDDVAVLEFVARRAREVKLCKIFAYATVTKGLKGEALTEMGLLSEAGAAGFTDGTAAVSNPQVMRRALSYARGFDALVIQHPEEKHLAGTGAMNEGEIATRLGLPGIPVAAELIMVERDLRLVEMTQGRYHAAHLSTASALDEIRQAKRRGLRVTCDTAPPYFALNESAVGDYRTFAKLSPPLRSEDDRRAVVAALKDGTIDVIASDHAPQDQDSKRVPFMQAEFGTSGLETLLAVSLELYHGGHLPLLKVLELMTVRPADLLRLPLGRLKAGAPADLVLFDLDRPWQIDADLLVSKSKNSAFDERPVQGVVLRTVVDGRAVFVRDAAG